MNDEIKDRRSLEPDVTAEMSVRMVVADHYMAFPVPGLDLVYSEFRGADIKQVPVLRIFGPASDGHKACVHIHGVFPYFYVPCGVSNPEPQLLYQIAASLDKALNISLKQANSTNQHVYRITLVKGLPFYGFHYKEHLFFKVFLYSPGLIKQAVELLNNGAVLGQSFQPHEAHLNFTLQFFIDFNLFGMSNVELQAVKFRKKGPTENTQASSGDVFENSGDTAKPQSMCYYEVDALASHIINRQRIGKGDGIENPGLEEVWNQEKERRKQLNLSMASKSLTQHRMNNETESHYRFEKMFWIKINSIIDKPVEIAPEAKESIYYPAESLEGSQLFNASDVSVHQPCDSFSGQSETLSGDFNETIVDESVALNCSLADHYSQITLDSEDMNFVEILKDMEQHVDEDSILGTQVDAPQEIDDSDDAEYSQIFNDTTLVQEDFETINTEVTERTEPLSELESGDEDGRIKWQDSFWEGANIPQLDGACDNEHTKKVRKRKMPRTRSLGLSYPKAKKKCAITKSLEINIKSDLDNSDEKHLSQIITSESENHDDKKNSDVDDIKSKLFKDISRNYVENDFKSPIQNKVNDNNTENNAKTESSVLYDIENNYEPKPGPSNIDVARTFSTRNKDESTDLIDCSFNSDSTPDNGIRSFYDTSKIFDVTLDNNDNVSNDSGEKPLEPISNIKVELETPAKDTLNESSFIRLYHSTTSSIKTLSSDVTVSQEYIRKVFLTPKVRPPTRNDIVSSLSLHNIPAIKHVIPYYSNYKDVGNKIEVGQMVLKLSSNAAQHQKQFVCIEGIISIGEWRKYLFMENNIMSPDETDLNTLKCLLSGNKKCVLEPVKKPPTAKEVKEWLESKNEMENSREKTVPLEQVEVNRALDELDNSQAIGLDTEDANNTISLERHDVTVKENTELSEGFQVSMQTDGSFLCFGGSSHHSETQHIDTAVLERDFLTVMALEVHTMVRGDLNPDPQFDAMTAMFITVTNDCPPGHFLPRNVTEVIVVDENPQKLLDRCGIPIAVTYVKNEGELIEKVIAAVDKWDPDILCAYEIELNSWGYLIERADALGLELVPEISRITDKNRHRKWKIEDNCYEGKILGRVIFNVWRLLRHELALSSYSFENTMYDILKERVPSYTHWKLAYWWQHDSRLLRWIPVEYYLTRLSGTIRILEKLDMINRTSELARLFGMQWWEVLSRGSQFRVESLMLRAARPLNLIALSPSVKQRATMKAPECLPLIFEPESRFYSDPVIVLDFQSLYPSMMIAYNYCFSTCIGRVQNISGDHSYEFGAWRLRIPKDKLEALVKNHLVHWSPVGVGFVSSAVRRGVLPALLRRILAARQAVKKTMKMQTDEGIKKAMHSRQLGLKLIANVTYGYTAANFSGRMPCVEVGDSVVAKGRETLERAVKLVENNPRWNVKVVYGDTDSMFVLVPGGTREQAFLIGQEIADAVTADNPSPVALKLEKVYQPCILQTKKRYVGYMYESADQSSPQYEAKGIETVRRDGCLAGVKLLQQSLCELFDTGDMSRVKALVLSTLARLTDGHMPVQELFFTREYNGAAGYRPGAVAPPLEIARRLAARDRRNVPRAGERVSWAVCAGAPGLPLVKLARTAREIYADPALRPHVAYYVSRVLLPPLHRCLSLIGADVFIWYRAMSLRPDCGVGGIVQYMWRSRCLGCGGRAPRSVCAPCSARPAHTATAVAERLHREGSLVRAASMICGSCCGHTVADACRNVECPVLWRLQTARVRLQQTREAVLSLPPHLCCDELEF